MILSNLQSKMKNDETENSLLDLNSGKNLIKAKKEKPKSRVWSFIEKWFAINLSTATLSMTKRNFQKLVNFVKIFYKTTISPTKNCLMVIFFSKKLLHALRKNFAVSLFPYLKLSLPLLIAECRKTWFFLSIKILLTYNCFLMGFSVS